MDQPRMKYAAQRLTVLLLATTGLFSHDCEAQTFPSFWDRGVDWVVQPNAAHGTTLGNPAPDSEGNLVWHYDWVGTGGGFGSAAPWYNEPLTQMVWDTSWFGAEGVWAVADNVGAVVRPNSFTHASAWLSSRPVVRWKNVTGQTLEVQLRGSLFVNWSGNGQLALPVDVDLLVAHRDGTTGALTPIYSATIPKPTNNTVPETVLVPIDAPPLVIGPDDELIFTHHAWETQTPQSRWVTVNDGPLCIVRDPIGTRYCGPAVTNSGYHAAEIAAAGSTRAADNDFALKALQLPWNSFGFFLASQTPGFVANAGGSQGNLCLGGSIGRFVGPGQVFSTGDAGSGALTVDLGAMPSPQQGLVQVQPGETWRFQCWLRDSNQAGATSNFTDAIAVAFH